MAKRNATLKLMPSSHVTSLPNAVIGSVLGYDPNLGVFVEFPGNRGGPVLARLFADINVDALRLAAESGGQVALLFEQGDPTLPLIIGLLQKPGEREARVDGRRIVLTGEEEIELRCGEASISLSKNGKLVIRGAYVETRAKGTNRIKGGSVQIN
jgi:hypothetical protein